MHVGYIDQHYAGVLVLSINADRFTAEKSLWVWAVYTRASGWRCDMRFGRRQGDGGAGGFAQAGVSFAAPGMEQAACG